MIHLGINEAAHIRIPHIDMVRNDVIDTASISFLIQVVDFTGIFV